MKNNDATQAENCKMEVTLL